MCFRSSRVLNPGKLTLSNLSFFFVCSSSSSLPLAPIKIPLPFYLKKHDVHHPCPHFQAKVGISEVIYSHIQPSFVSRGNLAPKYVDPGTKQRRARSHNGQKVFWHVHFFNGFEDIIDMGL